MIGFTCFKIFQLLQEDEFGGEVQLKQDDLLGGCSGCLGGDVGGMQSRKVGILKKYFEGRIDRIC